MEKVKKVFKTVSHSLEIASDWVLNLFKKCNFWIFVALIAIVGLVVRIEVLDLQSSDFMGFLEPWCNAIKVNGGFSDFGNTSAYVPHVQFVNPPYMDLWMSPHYDYTAPYLYVLTAVSYLPRAYFLVAIKWISIVFDFIMAVFIGLICRKILKSNTSFLFGFGVALMLPNVILNSAVWAQCDVIFSTFAVASLYFLIRGNNRTAMLLYGISFAFKIQAVFFLPVIIIVFVKKRINLFYLLYALLSIVIINLPALCMGMGFMDTFITPYKTQTEEYGYLNMNAPNMYLLIDIAANYNLEHIGEPNYLWREWFSGAGVIFTLGVCVVLFAIIYRKEFTFTAKKLVLISYLFATLVPFVLPHMHERYWFLADIIAVVFIACYPKKFYIALMSIYPSFRFCVNFIFSTQVQEQWQKVYLAVMMLVSIVLTLRLLYSEINKTDGEEFGLKAKALTLSTEETETVQDVQETEKTEEVTCQE